jgi:predicted acyl esterase
MLASLQLELGVPPDPTDFVPRGYAIININLREAYQSVSVIAFRGTQEAGYGYDILEACAKLP